jgi:predicted Zn-dependent protease
MFITYQEYSMAEATYLKGRKLVKNNYTFHLELANLYQIQKLFDKMIDEYFALLKENPSMIQTVQNRLQQSVYNSEDKSLIQLLQQKLIAQIQNEPDAVIFSEFLIWLYLQQNMFLQALNYAVSLDKRFKEDGSRIYSIGQMALSAKDYQTALKAFKYVIDKGSQSSWYFEAKSDYLLTLYYQVIDDKFYNKNKLIELETEFSNYLNQVGLNKYTFSIARILAQIKAFYLNKSDEAIEILNQIIKSNDFSQQQKNEVKLLLGDIMLMNDEIWEATLLYTQVEKGSFDDPLSHEAKYKKALLAYYTGDYLWAKAQTDILKASTSKLIANDAFNLSQFISDNIEIDTTYKSLRLFANSDFYVFKMQDSIAILFLDTLLMNPNFYELHDYALLKKADIYTRIKKLNKAIEIYDTILVHFDKKITAPQAAYKMANIYQYNLKNKDMAMKYLELLFNKYPESFYSNEARKRYRILRGDIIDETNNFEINF